MRVDADLMHEDYRQPGAMFVDVCRFCWDALFSTITDMDVDQEHPPYAEQEPACKCAICGDPLIAEDDTPETPGNL